MMKIAIYDRYLSTAGGGERYSCKAAEVLAGVEGYEVDLLTDIHADLKEVAQKLHLDLSKVRLRVFPLISDDFAREITREYDLFVNCTYLSPMSAHAKKNIYLCYFPTPFDVDFRFIHRFLLLFRPLALLLFQAASRMTSQFREVKVLEGLYDVKRFLLRRGSWSAKEASIVFHKDIRDLAFGLKNPQSSPKPNVHVAWSLQAGKAEQTSALQVPRGKKVLVRPSPEMLQQAQGQDKGPLVLHLSCETFVPQKDSGAAEDSRELGIVVYDESRVHRLKRLLLKAIGYIPLFLINYPLRLRFLDCYDRIVAISQYSSKWVRKNWDREPVILFPPVDVKSFARGKKQALILSVGRFFPEHHNKKQLELAKVFIEMLQQYPEAMKGYRLCLAGGLSQKKSHMDYVRSIQETARGYPIDILTNISFAELTALFAKAEIFWHASGAGLSEEESPEKFEHFGITTVEAMASGAIPIVIDKGGQVEIIQEGRNGFLFGDFEELKRKTLEVIKDRERFEDIRKNAMADSERFSNEHFARNLLEIVQSVMSGKQ